jgi:hypothetical protein
MVKKQTNRESLEKLIWLGKFSYGLYTVWIYNNQHGSNFQLNNPTGSRQAPIMLI